ncbi:hypothetical protein AAFC00_004581 [Neodothiora populina]|uniref:Uncharacterized protein n=1 Tax=Neodothiora populina TaxID=2781224 RepID=A0ABR3P2H2_9PEZI
MGIKDTGDYLTARAANPRTGLISPSVATVHTPRTPLTPGEALRLYSHTDLQVSPVKHISRQCGQNARKKQYRSTSSRWMQHDSGWSVEAIVEQAQPKMIHANIAATRAAGRPPTDRFIIPMPSGRDPRPFEKVETRSSQLTSLAQRTQHESHSTSGLNGRMISGGAGPRKFAEAVQKLRLHASEGRQAESEPSAGYATNRVIQMPSLSRCTDGESLPPTLQALRSTSSSSIDSIPRTTIDMPGSYTPVQKHFHHIKRKPIGSPRAIKDRRASSATAITTKSAAEKEVLLVTPAPASLIVQASATRTTRADESKAGRFRDFRHLPRVRIIHPETAQEQREVTTPVDLTMRSRSSDNHADENPSSAVPFTRHSRALKNTLPHDPALVGSHITHALARGITLFFKWTRRTWSSNPTTIHALNIITDETADPTARLDALRVLVRVGRRFALLLGVLVVLVRIGVMVWQVLVFVLWPVRAILMVMEWMWMERGV